MDIILQLAQELNLKKEQIEKTVALLDEGNTVPFSRCIFRRTAIANVIEATVSSISHFSFLISHLPKGFPWISFFN